MYHNYFNAVDPKTWSIKHAYANKKVDFPEASHESILSKINKDLRTCNNHEAAAVWLTKWKTLVKTLKNDEPKASSSVQHITNIESIATVETMFGDKHIVFNSDDATPPEPEAGTSSKANRSRSHECQYEFSESAPSADPSKFRELVFGYSMKTTSGNFSMQDAADLQALINTFKPTTIGQKLDMMAAKLLSSDLTDVYNLNALKLALSRIVDNVNGSVKCIFKKYIDDDGFWRRVSAIDTTLPPGLSPSLQAFYRDLIRRGRNPAGKLDDRLLQLAVAKERVLLLENRNLDTEKLQVLDVVDMVVKHCQYNSSSNKVANDSELTFYRKFCKILDELLLGTNLDVLEYVGKRKGSHMCIAFDKFVCSGETTCKASKTIMKKHERLFDSKSSSNAFGRRIDLILSSRDVELSTSEWKKATVPVKVSIKQQGKNIRMNKAILTSLLDLPLSDEAMDKVYTLGMDWTGPVGYMFKVSRLEDVFVASHVASMVMPETIDQLPSFLEILHVLCAWKNHHLDLKNVIVPAAIAKGQNELLSMLVASSSENPYLDMSPNVFYTPVKRRHSLVDDD
ncbi:hypothetical protein EC973_003499 [Apophysomyces ossiformis]|uniref:Uncharacterized protein n=1 Tax=Apophysomyces ossiformis TaxID=679940 RepID=A0A8H7BH70_9FUNG|nr:hypothetical protein EC973_003499 [Apophysomyces ossiformis]